MRINYLSDFKALVELTLGGVAVGVPDHDFALDFSTTGARKYRCERKGDVWTNCKPDGDKVLCLLDNHGLPCGTLRVRYFDYSPDSEMPDGNLLTVTPSSLDVQLVTGAGDGSDVEASVATDVAAAIARCEAAAEEAASVVARADELLEQMSGQVDEARGHADDAATAAQQAVASADAAHSSEVSASSSASAASSSVTQAEEIVAQDLVYFNNINQLLDVILYGE